MVTQKVRAQLGWIMAIISKPVPFRKRIVPRFIIGVGIGIGIERLKMTTPIQIPTPTPICLPTGNGKRGTPKKKAQG
jgi:hypothetical protein